MSECNHDCDNCAGSCSGEPEKLAANKLSNVKKVIGVMSGKGGVGKSLVTSLLAVLANRRGHLAAVLDADMTGPSIPAAFGVHGRAEGSDVGIFPKKSKTGVEIMSVNLLLEHETDPVIWRGPVVAGMLTQFWTEVVWGDVDFMFVDMPPGTGDIALTAFQSIPVDGVIIVATPQELVGMIVEKAVKMAGMMNVPVLALVENMSYVKCPDCGREIEIFGQSRLMATGADIGVTALARIPVEPKLAAACDEGMIELFEGDWLDDIMEMLENL